MIWSAIDVQGYGAATDGKSGLDYITAYKAARAAAERRHSRIHRPAWIVVLVICIVTSAIGMAILLVNVAANLLVLSRT